MPDGAVASSAATRQVAWPQWGERQFAPDAPRRQPPRMGYQPGLDGLRAVWLFVVMAYHAGFSWMHGGSVSLEVFFVLSGFLITTLLLDERERSGRVALGQFWLRRARRLLPALIVMLVVVSIISVVVGDGTQLTQLRTDLPWATLYAGNWGQILGDVPYYADTAPLLRHLWSLGIEEQFYLLWPLAFVLLVRRRIARAGCARLLAGLALAVMAVTFLIQVTGPGPLFGDVERTNFLYLSTLTRSSGLLLGVAAAFVWRPWRSARRTWRPQVGTALDLTGLLALIGLVWLAAVTTLTEGYVYQWALAVISILSLAAVRPRRSTQLRHLPVALADLHLHGGHRRVRRQAAAGARRHRRRRRDLVPLYRAPDPRGQPRALVAAGRAGQGSAPAAGAGRRVGGVRRRARVGRR